MLQVAKDKHKRKDLLNGIRFVVLMLKYRHFIYNNTSLYKYIM